MNKFLTYNGTQPIYLGDIDFMQNAAAQVQSLLIRSLVDADGLTLNAILQGLVFSVPSPGQIAWTAGIVALDGEILPVSAGTIAAASIDLLYLHVYSALSGTRTFKDGQSHDCYDTRVAIIDTTSSNGVAVSSVQRLYHRPEDVVLVSDNVSGGFIRSAKLTRKNDAWSLDAGFDLSPGNNTVSGSVTFGPVEGVTQEVFDSIPSSTFPCIIGVSTESVYGFTMCTVSKNAGALTVTVEFEGSTVISVDNSGGAVGRLNIVIPIKLEIL